MPPVPSRPYAVRGVRKSSEEPSVTTVLQMLPKPGIPWGAAQETSTFAVLHPEKWQHLPEAEAIDLLRKHHMGIWLGRAAMGTHVVHGVAELFAAGVEVTASTIERIVDDAIEHDSDARAWKDRDRDDLLEECFGYVLGVEQWFADMQPRNIRSEVVVRWPGLFIGSTDLRCDIANPETGEYEDWLLDWKSTARQSEDSGIYGDSWVLQLAMYGMAREEVLFEMQEDPKLRSGFRVVEVGTRPWTPPQRYGVIHLRGDENYTPFELDVTRDVQRTAVRLARAYPKWKAIPEKPRVLRVKEPIA